MLLRAQTLVLCLFVLLFGVTAQAQTGESKNDNQQIIPASYEINLQLLATTENNSEKLPANFSAIEKKLKTAFGQSNFRPVLSMLNRTSEKGVLTVKAVSSLNQIPGIDKYTSFVQFSLNGLRGENAEVKIDTLRFDLRIPIFTTVAQEGQSVSAVNYESIGITANPLSVSINEPTIIGTLTTSRPGELLVLVLTVNPETNRTRNLAQKQ